MESILTSIKKLLGVAEDYIHFDDDIIIHINTVFMDLTGLKVGPSSGFIITDKTAVWTDFVSNPLRLAAIKSYMYLRVKLLFDPPTNASLLNSMQQQIEKFEWLINVAAETDNSGSGVVDELNALITKLNAENAVLAARVEELESDFALNEWVNEYLIDKGKPNNAIFYGNEKITVIPEQFDFTQLEKATFLFYGCVNLKEIKPIIDFSRVTNADAWMDMCEALEEIRFVPDTIGASGELARIDILSPNLTKASVDSILNGYMANSGVMLYISQDVVGRFTTEQWDIVTSKNIVIM